MRCTSCGASVGTRRSRPRPPRRPDGSELLTFIESLLPRNLTTDVRDDARQAIACAVLTGKERRKNLNFRTVRPFIRDAYGLNDAHRFISLDAPTAGSGTFGECLAG